MRAVLMSQTLPLQSSAIRHCLLEPEKEPGPDLRSTEDSGCSERSSEPPTLTLLEGRFFLSATVLLVSGGSKLADPAPTSGALRAAGLLSGRGVVLTLAVAEVAVGGAGLLFGGNWAGWGVAAFYGSFGIFVAVALNRHLPIASCGCFGKSDTPPSVVHLWLNAAGLGAGLWAAFNNSPSLVAVLGDQPLAGVPYVLLLAAGTYAIYLMLTALPMVRGTQAPGSP